MKQFVSFGEFLKTLTDQYGAVSVNTQVSELGVGVEAFTEFIMRSYPDLDYSIVQYHLKDEMSMGEVYHSFFT